MKSFFNNLWKKALAHKFISVFLAALVLWGGYTVYGKITATSVPTRYVVSQVQKGTLLTTVSGTGQVSNVNSLDVKPKVSGDIVRIPVAVGQTVNAGAILVQLDTTDLAKSVRDAQANLDGAKITLEKLTQPADVLSLTQAENALTQAEQSRQNAADDLVKVYDDGFNTVANAFIDLPGVMTGLDSILNGSTVNASQANSDAYFNLISAFQPSAQQFRDSALTSYAIARTAYNANLTDYKTASRYSDKATIDTLISETYSTVKTISEAIKNTKSFLDLVNDTLSTSNRITKPPAILTTHETNVQTYTGTTNNHLGNLLNIENSIKADQDAITNANLSITEKTQSLAKLKAGPDPLDIQSQQLAITQKQNALLDAQQNLADSSVRAPFAGVVGKISVKVGDPASSGSAVVTLITNTQTANISLNEVDVAKVQLGQKANMTFDAVSGLTITGKVSQIDAIGTVTQGVVNYNVEITFDTQDSRIKPGMSASADIITSVMQNLLMVPNSAVKTQNGISSVEVLSGVNISADNGPTQTIATTMAPAKQTVEIGVSNDSSTEITGGVNEGDFIVTKVLATSTVATPAAGGGIRIPGIGGTGR